jgi:methyl-accepting chemotaxis protein
MGNIGFGKKLYISSLGIILLTILIIAIVNFYQTEKSFLSKGKAGIQNVSDVLLKTIEMQYNFQKNKLDSDLGMLMTESESAGNIMVVKARTAEMDVFDINSSEKSHLTLPKLIFGLEFVTGEYSIVDKVGKFSTSQIAIYQAFEEKLIKVSTSFLNQDETRPVGGYFSASTDEYKSMISGTPYLFLSGTGRDKTLQILSPFTDQIENALAGAYSIRSRILTKDLEGLVKKINVSGHGYSFICDQDGEILVHPDNAYSKLNISAFKGGEEIRKTKAGFVSYEYGDNLYYGYVNYFKPWDLYFAVAVSEAELMAGINQQILTSAGLSGIIALILGALIIGLMNRQLMNNMNGMATLAKEVAKGNFKHTFTYTAKDAIHDTVDSMNEMTGELAQMIRNLNSGVDTLSTASGELNQISDQMSKGAETSVTKVNTVAAAAEEMSVNMDSVATAMEQASTNVEIVASGTSQMSDSIERVAENSNHTREITSRAVEKARQTSERVKQLGKAAEEINKVTETINNISSQTNLLALNATIEAARAGEAGKGFAVVATEIKALAGQTAGATQDIAVNIKEIQDQINGAVTEIQEISTIVHEINNFVNEAAAAIEIQSTTTNEIAENIGQVSQGIQEVNGNVSQSSAVSSQVATEIADVLSTSRQISEFSSDVKEKAAILNSVMIQLKAMTEKFQI